MAQGRMVRRLLYHFLHKYHHYKVPDKGEHSGSSTSIYLIAKVHVSSFQYYFMQSSVIEIIVIKKKTINTILIFDINWLAFLDLREPIFHCEAYFSLHVITVNTFFVTCYDALKKYVFIYPPKNILTDLNPMLFLILCHEQGNKLYYNTLYSQFLC